MSVKPVVPKYFRAVTLIKVAIMSYYPQYFAVIAHNTEQHFGSAVPPKNRILPPEVIYPALATTGLNAITAFSHKIPESQTIRT